MWVVDALKGVGRGAKGFGSAMLCNKENERVRLAPSGVGVVGPSRVDEDEVGAAAAAAED
jgi:hypothetical protein